MPYTSNKELPGHVKKYSKKLQDTWRGVFNSTISKGDTEADAFKFANGVIKKRMESHSVDLEEKDRFNYMLDKFLGVIK